MTKKIINVLALVRDTYYSECFIEDITNFNSNSVVILYNDKKAWIIYKPKNYRINKYIISNWSNARFQYLIPLFMLFDNLKLFMFIIRVCLKFRVQVAVIEAFYLVGLVGILRKLQLIKKLVYIIGDWFPGSDRKAHV